MVEPWARQAAMDHMEAILGDWMYRRSLFGKTLSAAAMGFQVWLPLKQHNFPMCRHGVGDDFRTMTQQSLALDQMGALGSAAPATHGQEWYKQTLALTGSVGVEG